MFWRRWSRKLIHLIRPSLREGRTAQARGRGQMIHVILLDGTMSTLKNGCETNAGLTYKLLSETAGAGMSVYYEAGIQWRDWRSFHHVITGRGINRQIRRAYGYLSSRYRPGDRIFLIGYSRGAYAVRSLGGLIDQIGLLRPEHATVRNVRQAYRHYQVPPNSPAATDFKQAFCHAQTPIDMVGVWDTVKALGLQLPILWRWSEKAHAFHNHVLGDSVQHGYHALALHETRGVYAPVLWKTRDGFSGRVEQVWFRGAHGDIGGDLGGFDAARPLSNIPLVWMLDKAAAIDLPLPTNWRDRFTQDTEAPSVGTWHGLGKIFWLRRKRVVGRDASESIHHTVAPKDAPKMATRQVV